VFQFDGQGNMVNANLHDYRLPTVSDMPDVITTFVETAEPNGPYGAKGAGEAIIAPVAPTVVNAIRHATGIQVTDLPVTPEVILRATGTLK
jgi:aldehyde oxidoreductase